MFSSDKTNNSIRNALFDVAVQLSVPTVLSTATAATKFRAYSTTDDINQSSRSHSHSPTVQTRYSLSSVSTHVSRQAELTKAKVLRDVATQSSPCSDDHEKILLTQQRPNRLNLILDKNNNPTVTSISATSHEYLSVPKYPSHHSSPSSSPTRRNKSIRNTLLGIWQGINSDELRSATSSPMDPKFFEDRVRIVICT